MKGGTAGASRVGHFGRQSTQPILTGTALFVTVTHGSAPVFILDVECHTVFTTRIFVVGGGEAVSMLAKTIQARACGNANTCIHTQFLAKPDLTITTDCRTFLFDTDSVFGRTGGAKACGVFGYAIGINGHAQSLFGNPDVAVIAELQADQSSLFIGCTQLVLTASDFSASSGFSTGRGVHIA